MDRTLIFPSISLLSENYSKLRQQGRFNKYHICTLSDEPYSVNDKNIFIFTPERYLSFLDKNKNVRFDFSFVDEIYKIDNSFIIDQDRNDENERDVAYRLALEYVCNFSYDVLLAGPYMTLPVESSTNMESFTNFAKHNGFKFLIYNEIEIVEKDYHHVKSGKTAIDDKIIPAGIARKMEKITCIVTTLSTPEENTIIYCGRRSSTESYVKQLLTNNVALSCINRFYINRRHQIFTDFIKNLAEYLPR